MSVPYGFRIFVLTAHPNRVKGVDALPANDESKVKDEIFHLLEQLSETKSFFVTPRTPDADDDRPMKPTISVSVNQPTMVSKQMIVVQVATGEVGTHREATHPQKKAKKLENYSAEVVYFVSFHFPRFGDRFFMVCQTYSRRDVADRLLRLMKKQSYENRKASEAKDAAIRKSAREAGERPPKKQVFYKLAFDKHQASDDAYIDEILGAAKQVSATFTALAPDDRGGNGENVEKTLTIKLNGKETFRDVGRRVSKTWKERTRRDEVRSRAQGVSELAEELFEQGLIAEDEVAEYDNSRLTVRSESGEATTIAVDTLKEVFTYPVSQGKPDAYYFYKRVSVRLATVAAQEEIELANIDPQEVSECLDAST